MWQLVKRLALFGFLVAIVVVAGGWSWQKLNQKRYPDRALAERLLEERLGSMAPEQRKLVDIAVKRDPLMAVLAAEEGGWTRIAYFVEHGPDDILEIERLALNAVLHASIDSDTAGRFADAAFTQLAILERIDPAAEHLLRSELNNLSPMEYSNIGFDASYLLIAPKLNKRHRGTFRQYQDVLTPLIICADPGQWDALLDRFEKALPRVARIARDENLGVLYAWVYMLHRELAETLFQALSVDEMKLQERDVLDFIGLNASVLTKSGFSDAVIADQISRLKKQFGPDEKHSLFEWACSDGTVYWLIVEMQKAVPDLDRDKEFRKAVTILNRYAGTNIPAILTCYADDPDCFRAASDALLRFDNFGDHDESKQQTAAKFLNHFQNDSVFKAELVKHGAVLIPALSVGGEDALASISRNPNDIYKYVTVDGVPIAGKPWWTWVPGGNLAYLGRELAAGRTPEAADWAWAGGDALIFLPMVKGGSVPVRTATTAGGKTPGRVIANGARELGEEVADRTWGRAALNEPLILLRTAGVRTAKGAVSAAKWGAGNPVKTAILAAGTATALCALYPDRAAQILDGSSRWVAERLAVLANETGRALAGLPGEFVKGVLEKTKQLAAEKPLLAPVFYALASGLILTVLLLPLYLLKRIVPELYAFVEHFVVESFRFVGRVVAWSAQRTVRALRPAA